MLVKAPGTTHILVTGGAGFVGSAIVSAIVAKHPEWRVTIVDIKPEEIWQSPISSARTDYLQADIRVPNECYNAVELCDPDCIVHTAGLVPSINARYGRNPVVQHNLNKLNVEGTANMLEAAKENNIASFIYTSSSTILTDDLIHDYPNYKEDLPYPKSSLIYGQSKAIAEQMVINMQSDAMSTCALRPTVIFGPGDVQLIPSIHSCIAAGETKYQIGQADNLNDFTYIDNVADAHVLAIENLLSSKTAAGQVIHITNDQPVTFRDFMLAVWAQFDHVPSTTIRIPGSLAYVMGFLSECKGLLSGRPGALSRGSVQDGQMTRYASQKKAKEILGYRPRVPLWDAVVISCAAYKDSLARKQSRT